MTSTNVKRTMFKDVPDPIRNVLRHAFNSYRRGGGTITELVIKTGLAKRTIENAMDPKGSTTFPARITAAFILKGCGIDTRYFYSGSNEEFHPQRFNDWVNNQVKPRVQPSKRKRPKKR